MCRDGRFVIAGGGDVDVVAIVGSSPSSVTGMGGPTLIHFSSHTVNSADDSEHPVIGNQMFFEPTTSCGALLHATSNNGDGRVANCTQQRTGMCMSVY